MPSNQYHLLQLHLLLCALLLTSGQRTPVRVPPRNLQVPNFGGESFERFDTGSASTSSSGSSESQETSEEMREQLKQLLGDQLATAFAPLATTPFSRRQPAIASPNSGAAARSQFANDPDQGQAEESPDQDGEEEEAEEEEEEEEQEEATPQPQPLPPALPQPGGVLEELAGGQVGEELEDYNAWRDNFYELNEDGSYIFGYSIPHGVRRWEKGYYSEEQHGRVVEGFYVQPRHDSQGLRYELRCYRADSEGYQPRPVEFLRTPPIVRRDAIPRVNCFQNAKK
ncbi:histone-lysine N-methyltransferase SETD1A [Drosophila sechellia]|uniref:GM17611 n=1 Tax=Drosophila sechellia TaxID=7238 RepID=B4IG30_DROSE|nr:histone-lysine N-methyltransferase SETD1A [Drosophila sechellia]EDW48764.1 GM17611 [Drosophila sechellia]